jgi:hypothetical protein
VTPSMTFPLPLRGNVSALVYFDSLRSDRSRRSSCSRRYRYDCGGMLEYTCCTRLDYDRDRILILYSKSMPCLVLQVGPLYVYIYSPERLNNTSIIFRHTSLPLPFYSR